MSDLVCPRCGTTAGDGAYCATCGLHLAEQPQLLTREQWEHNSAESPTHAGSDHNWSPPAPAHQTVAPPSYSPPTPPAYAPPAPPGYPAPAPGYMPPPAAVRTNGMAVASLVLGLLWLWGLGGLLAVIFGFAAIGQIDASGGTQSGRGMAVAGIILGGTGLILALIVTLVVVGAD